jgi:hypothetical protein
MEERTAATTTPPSEKPGIVSKTLRVIAYPVSAFAGYWVAKQRIRDSAYENAKFHNAFGAKGEMVRRGEEGVQKFHEKLKEIGTEAQKAIRDGTPFDIVEKVGHHHAAHKQDVEAGLKAVGLGPLYKRWKFNTPHQKNMAILDGVTIAGISIGALLTMADSKTLSHLFVSKDREKGK